MLKDKKKVIGLFISSLICSFFCSFLLYLCLTEYNDFIVEFMKSVKENNLGLSVSLILYPVIVIISFMLYSGNYIVNSGYDISVKKTKKKKK